MSSDDFPDSMLPGARLAVGLDDDDLPDNSGRAHDDDDEEEEEEEPRNGGDDDDDDEDEDEDEEVGPSRKRQKRSNPVNRFLDVEAEVDNDDDEYDEDEEEGYGGTRDFITDDPADTEESRHRIISGHQRIDREKDAILEQNAEEVARRIKERYAARSGTARYNGDTNQMPQRLLMPSVKDPFLWQVKVKIGREKEIVFSLMRKFIETEFTPSPMDITSAFYRDSLPGIIYIEARNEKQVSHAIQGLVGVYPSRGFVLVPIDEMTSLLKLKKIETNITPGTWVRIKRGKYAGDLAQVLDVTDNGEEAGLKFIPRIDLTPKEMDSLKRKKGFPSASSSAMSRPPQRLFHVEEISKVYGPRSCVRKKNDEFVFNGDTYKAGFLEKDVKIQGLVTENVNPTLDEITAFQAGGEDGDEPSTLDLSIIHNAAKKAATAVLQPGDHVEVFEGEQIGLDGIVESIRDEVVLLRPKLLDMEDQRIEIPAASVRKRFKSGDHVKVMAGKNADETGLVVAVNGDIVTIWSDVSNQEVTVFSKDVREAAEVGNGTNAVGQYELHDLVQLDQQTVGVVFKTERVSLRVLDQNGIVRQVQPHQITMRRDSNRAVATDADGQPIRIQDTLKEVAGERRRGTVLHIYQSQVAFLHNREISDNGGVFVVRCRALTSLAPKTNFGARANPMADPAAAAGNMNQLGGRGPKDRLINMNVTVVKGEFKGYEGTVKDTNGNTARVELVTNRKIISIDKSKLRRKNPNTGKLEEVEQAFSNMGPPSGFGGGRSSGFGGQSGGSSNGWGASMSPPTRTPNPYLSSSGGRTPGQGITGRTPNPYASGGRTPGGWAPSAPTPNPYQNAGGRTPGGWASAVTPNPYLSSGSRTPAGAGFGSSSTVDNGGWGASSPAYEGSTPAPQAWGTPAPITAPTPAAETPGGWGAPTPFSAPTPGALNYWTTPVYSAQTPFSAPTPGAGLIGGYGHSEEPESDAHWLEAFHDCTKPICARFESKGRYLSGVHDGKLCTVRDFNTSGPSGSTVTILFDDSGEEISYIPVERLERVDLKTDDHAWSSSGKIVKILEKEGLRCQVLVISNGSDALDSFSEAQLAKIVY